MKSVQFRIGTAAILCGMMVAALLLMFPTTTSAARKVESNAFVVNAQAGFCSVTVQRGEALYMIAARYHTTTAYLAQINNLYNPNYIYAGMTLRVPCGPQPQPYPQPQPQPYPHPGNNICSYYTVQRGDWLKTIAYRFGISWQALAQANNLYNANYIYVGQKLAVPCSQYPPICPGCPPVCPGCPCQGCPPVYPTPVPVCPGCPPPCQGCPCQGCPPFTPVPVCPGCPPPCQGCPCQGCPPFTPVPVYNNVEIRDNYYAPPVITIHQYQVVQWTNKGNAPHSVTQGLCPNQQCQATPGGFQSGRINPGGTYAFQFNQQGTFAYFDGFSGVGATVAVVP